MHAFTLAEQVVLWLLLTPSGLATLGLVVSSVLVLIFVLIRRQLRIIHRRKLAAASEELMTAKPLQIDSEQWTRAVGAALELLAITRMTRHFTDRTNIAAWAAVNATVVLRAGTVNGLTQWIAHKGARPKQEPAYRDMPVIPWRQGANQSLARKALVCNRHERQAMNDETIEQEIQAKASTAPRVTPADIEANIASEHYFTAEQGAFAAFDPPRGADIVPPALSLLTFCVLVLRNGFTVTGESACASPENFNAEIGRKIARQNAVQKIWPLMGYELRTKLATQ